MNHELIDRRISTAYYIADLSLLGKTDKQGKPLIDHVQRVAIKLVEEKGGFTHNQLIAAYLHDCIEDGGLSYSTIKEIFGDEIANIVHFLTRYPNILYFPYIQAMIDRCPEALLVKLCDLEDNLDESRGPLPEKHRERYMLAKKMIEEAIEKYSRE